MVALSLKKFPEHIRQDIIIGKPVALKDLILVPIIDISLMAGFREENSPLGGAGVTGEIAAAAILVIRGEEAKLLPVKDSIDMVRLRALVPEILEEINHKE